MRTATILLFTCVFISVAETGYTQSAKVTLNKNKVNLKEVLNEIENQTDYLFIYNDEVNTNKTVSVRTKNGTVSKVLTHVLKDSDIDFMMEGNHIILSYIEAKKKEEAKEKEVIEAVKQQGKTVTGRVTDVNGESLPGVTVLIKGTTKGTITDVGGNFTLSDVFESGILQFSFVGMQTQEIVLGNQARIDVTMLEDSIGLEEVIAIGYGTMKKSDLTGSVSQVKQEDINSFPTTNVMQAMSGKTSGVQVIQNTGAPGAGISIRVRGSNSIRGSNEPLYVIDGFPVDNPTVINNSDIESIEILKDASATAIYGSRGANGVVLISSKKGKAGKTIIDFESNYSSQSIANKLDLMNAKEYAIFNNIQYLNDFGKEYFKQDQINAFGEGTDWQNKVFKTAPMVTTSLNVRGGDKNTKFSISGSTFNQDGIIKGSDYNRYSVGTNIDHQFNEKFSASLSSTLSRLNTERKDSGGGSRGTSLIGSTLGAPPTLPFYDEDNQYTQLANAYPFVAPDIINPLNFVNEQSRKITANIALINAALIFKPIDEVTIRVSGGIENRDDKTDEYTTRHFYNSEGRASISSSQFSSLLNENTINYNKTFNRIHRISALAGLTYQDFERTYVAGSGTGFLSDVFETYNLSAAEVPGIPTSGFSKSVLLSYLGRINYVYNDKYFATVTFRADGSSKFSKNNKWAYFPSGALAWRISEESFLKDNIVVSNLKLRTSIGYTGSQAIGPYATLNQLFPQKVVFNDELTPSFAPGSNLPGDLKWETTKQFNIGFDIGFMNNRFSLVADYYMKKTKDLLNTVRLPSSLGFTSTIQNVGEVENNGFEFNLESRVLEGNFKWDINANISFNRNKVVKLYNKEDILGPGTGTLAMDGNINILREGQPMGVFYGHIEDGYDESGWIKYKDIDLNGSISSNDRTYIGDPNPDFIYGINSQMSYKNFDLNIFIQGSQGNDLMNLSKVAYAYEYGYGLNLLSEVLDNHWTPEKTDAKYPRISNKNKYHLSNRFVEDGSYIRLKNIQVAYNIPVKSLRLKWLESFQIYISGQNLITFTKYEGQDPEVNAQGATNLGVDNNVYPMTKSYTTGLRIRF